MSIIRSRGKRKVVPPHSGILFSHTKEGNTGICYNMTLEDVMLSERNQTRSPRIVRFHLHGIFRTGKSVETKGNQWLPRAKGWGDMGSDYSMGLGFCLR